MVYTVTSSANQEDKMENILVSIDYEGPVFVVGGNENDDMEHILEYVASILQEEGDEIHIIPASEYGKDGFESPEDIYLDCTSFGGEPCYLLNGNGVVVWGPIQEYEIEDIDWDDVSEYEADDYF